MKPTFNIYVVSDTHFGHVNIIRHANRPFADMETMDKELQNRWNRQVRPTDVIIALGDMVWTGGSADKIKEYFKKLNGRIILVMGNHDQKGYSWYLSNGVDFVCDRFVWEFNGKRILFVHDSSNASIEDTQKYSYILHGHHHGNTPLVREVNGCTFVNVSVENINYTPMNLITLLSRLTQGFYHKR